MLVSLGIKHFIYGIFIKLQKIYFQFNVVLRSDDILSINIYHLYVSLILYF